jgi:putative transposase
LYRAVDTEGHTIDFLLSSTRGRDAAEAFLRTAIRPYGLPAKIIIDRSGAHTAAIPHYTNTHQTTLVIRHSQYWNHIVEQDHRAVKRFPYPLLGCKSLWAARCTVAGMEGMHAIRHGQQATTEHARHPPAEQCSAWAASIAHSDYFARLHRNCATNPYLRQFLSTKAHP